jgi:hypothetical protein
MPNPFLVPGTFDEFSFNGPLKEIEVGAATSTFNCQYVYSFWKQWVNEGNAQYEPAFRPIGGDDLGGGNKIAFYAFLSNQWRIRIPPNLNNLSVTSGILATDELDNPFRFNGVLITLQQPISVQFVDNPSVVALEQDVKELKLQQQNTIIPNQETQIDLQVSIAATADKIYNKVVSIGNTVDITYGTVVGINDIVSDTNNEVISINNIVIDIKTNTNLIPALL